MSKVYKYVNGLSNSITDEIFSKRNMEHNLKNNRASHRKLARQYRLESVSHKTSRLC